MSAGHDALGSRENDEPHAVEDGGDLGAGDELAQTGLGLALETANRGLGLVRVLQREHELLRELGGHVGVLDVAGSLHHLLRL